MESSGSSSANSIWSRSRDSRLSTDDQSSARISRTSRGRGLSDGSLSERTSRRTAGEKSGSKPCSRIAAAAAARRVSARGVVIRENQRKLYSDQHIGRRWRRNREKLQ